MAEENEPTDLPPKKKSGLMTAIKGVGFVGVIVLLQVAAASVLIPSSEETQMIAEQLAAAEAAAEPDAMHAVDGSKHDTESVVTANMVEVNLGNYHVLTPNTDKGTSLNVDFELFGTVLAEEEGDFLQMFESSERRVREQILITIRSAEATDLTDPELGLIKRRILEKTNRSLGKPLIQEVIFSKFSFMER